MDFNVFSNHLWDRVGESHSQDVFVQNPDMTTTTGLSVHVDSMRQMIGFFPDARVTAHPVRIASGDWTAIIGVFEGTFSKPMPNPAGGDPIPPTGKSFKIQMSTISHWKGNVMDREYLFWDNVDFYKQLGLMPGTPMTKGDPGPISASGVDTDISRQEMDRRLAQLDNMDFVVWTNQQWTRIPESHADNVIAITPNGRVTKGNKVHIEDMKEMFTWAPDARITRHPVKFGQGDWTVMIGEMEGTFSKPMASPTGGKPVQPTGKHFKIQMATYSHWNSQGKMDIEYLFWDNQSIMKQMGML